MIMVVIMSAFACILVRSRRGQRLGIETGLADRFQRLIQVFRIGADSQGAGAELEPQEADARQGLQGPADLTLL